MHSNNRDGCDRAQEVEFINVWPGLLPLPEDNLLVRFAFLSDTKRTLRFYARGERYRHLVEQFKKETYGT